MKITDTCQAYFNGIPEIINFRNNDLKTNLISSLKVLSLITGVIPLFFAITYGIASLVDRVSHKKGGSEGDQKVAQVFSQSINGIDLSPKINEMSESQISRYIEKNLKNTKLTRDVYYKLFNPKKGELDEKYKNRFALLSDGTAGAAVDEIGAELIDLMSETQLLHYLKNLTGEQLNEHVFRKLFLDDQHKVQEHHKERFALLSNETATTAVDKIGTKIIDLMSEGQLLHYLENLSIENLDISTYRKLFNNWDDNEENKRRFALLTDEKACAAVDKFDRIVIDVMSEKQLSYYLTHLDIEKFNEDLLYKLFHSEIIKENKRRFAMLPDESASAVIYKFGNLVLKLITEKQLSYHITHFNIEKFKDKFNNSLLFFYDELPENKRHFAMLSDENARFFVDKDNSHAYLLSDTQLSYYLNNLNDVPPPDLFDRLFVVNNTVERDRRLALISKEQIKTAVSEKLKLT